MVLLFVFVDLIGCEIFKSRTLYNVDILSSRPQYFLFDQISLCNAVTPNNTLTSDIPQLVQSGFHAKTHQDNFPGE